MKRFSAFPLRPMRPVGVFGVTWQLYRRGFVSMLLFSLILLALPQAICTFLQSYLLSVDLTGLATVLTIATLLVLYPMYLGVLHTEYRQRMFGYSGNLRELFRTCRYGLSKYYGAYWATIVYLLGIALVLVLLLVAAAAILLLRPGMSLLENGIYWWNTLPGQFSGSFEVVSTVVILLLVQIPGCAVLLAFPAVAHEGKRGFAALGRSFRLNRRRYGRIFLFTLVPLAVRILANVAVLLIGDTMPPLWLAAVTDGVSLLLACLYTPYQAAICTTLYFDGIAREQQAWQQTHCPQAADDASAQQAEPAAAEEPDTPAEEESPAEATGTPAESEPAADAAVPVKESDTPAEGEPAADAAVPVKESDTPAESEPAADAAVPVKESDNAAEAMTDTAAAQKTVLSAPETPVPAALTEPVPADVPEQADIPTV